jgi:hypothetical protein
MEVLRLLNAVTFTKLYFVPRKLNTQVQGLSLTNSYNSCEIVHIVFLQHEPVLYTNPLQ